MKLLYFSFLIVGSSHFFVHSMHGGQQYSIEKVPYTAHIYIYFQDGDVTSCGASILSNRWILTAAHCIRSSSEEKNYNYSLVDFGINESYQKSKTEMYNISRAMRHPLYSGEKTRWNNDIGLIELVKPIKLDDKRQTMPISKNSPKPGDEVTITGYGNDNEEFVDYLQMGRQTVVDQEECRKAFKTSEEYNFKIGKEVFCVDSSVVDAGRGDSGDPVVLNGKIVGVAVEGWTAPRPNIYVNVAHYYDWIAEKTGIKFD